jgi:uncharacterized membrane protein YoaK (UPF0700 family)
MTVERLDVGTLAQRHLRLWLMLYLTAVTGALDAVGYLGLDRVFTGNMTGNVVILGMGIAAQESLPVAGPLIALSGYITGAATVGRLMRGRRRGWNTMVLGGLAALGHRRLWAVIAIFCGALAGSLMMKVDISWPAYFAAASTFATAALGQRFWDRAGAHTS